MFNITAMFYITIQVALPQTKCCEKNGSAVGGSFYYYGGLDLRQGYLYRYKREKKMCDR